MCALVDVETAKVYCYYSVRINRMLTLTEESNAPISVEKAADRQHVERITVADGLLAISSSNLKREKKYK